MNSVHSTHILKKIVWLKLIAWRVATRAPVLSVSSFDDGAFIIRKICLSEKERFLDSDILLGGLVHFRVKRQCELLISRLTALPCDFTQMTSFIERVLEYPLKWCTYSVDMAGAMWNCFHLSMFCVHHTTMHHVTSCKATCVKDMRVWQKPATSLLAIWSGSFTCYCGNTEVEQIAK